jgi:hypothetical protein
MTPTERLECVVRQLVSVTGEANRLARASMQQAFTLGELEKRWGRSRDGVLGLLRTHTSHHGERGKRLPVHLNDVLAVDEALAREQAKRATAVAAMPHLQVAS